jgi:hypothetical protein
MAKISQIYNKIGKTQHELDFVDIDINKDFPVYLNPFVFSSRSDPFSIDASRTVRSFFQHNLSLINNGYIKEARSNFSYLNEPNETCLGMSIKKPKGKGIGEMNADDLFNSILNSKALKTGLVDHLEDTAIFIDGIGRDKVSDMTTNIIRLNLIKYTQNQCNLLGIPLTKDVPSGFFWDQTSKKWDQIFTDMLIVNEKLVLLVPKGVVSYVKEFNHNKYFQHHALDFLQDDHLKRNTNLVQTVYDKNGKIKRRFVTKKDLKDKEISGEKQSLVEFTKKYPEIFKNFRNDTKSKIQSISDSDFDSLNINNFVDFLISQLKKIRTGDKGASNYHSLMIGILEFIFYPNLINPIKELEINNGRKRIDISFDNGAPIEGFFYRLQHSFNIPCPYIFIECKNYTKDIKNPELDQMIGRFSPNRGKFGIIVCRSIDNEDLFINRCADSYKDQHGLIIPITDEDIINILEKRKSGNNHFEDEILSDKARKIMNL